MNKSALFVRHKAKAGMREKVKEIWNRHVRPRVENNPHHLSYFFCYDANDDDVVCVFQLYDSADAAKDFMSGDWYMEYLNEIKRVVDTPPVIQTAYPQWIKGMV